MPDPCAAEKSVFLAAIEITSADERAAYLSQACKDNPQLRGEVEKLLQAHAAPQRVLDAAQAATPTVDEPLAPERPGTIIGPYKLLEPIGEGGFGLVFMAEQQRPVRRKVAVKVLKPGMDSRQVIARFEAERQALALMDHPNIAKVLDADETDTGRPYFAMELVRGVPITEYCDRNNLTPRQRLELFLIVCQAVQHAHQKGIIHRDLKPSNVLVTLHDGTPVVKVIDFGIAKALGQQLTDKTLYTGFAQMIGTPLYMSPEQAEMSGLDVDTRSDIYSLGVLLYELLTGTTPFDKERLSKAGFDEIRRIIREEDPAKPSTRISTMGQAATPVSARRQSDPKRLSQLFRGELDWIVMKALEKDRNRRYETAGLLAADVQHYLHDEPVAACPPSSWYLFRKFARRRRTALTMAAVVTTALVVAAGSVGWVARDQSAREAIVAERDLAVKNKERAEEAEKRALAAERENKVRAHLARAVVARRSSEPGRRTRALAEIRAVLALGPSASLRHDLRNEAIAALCLADMQIDREVGSEIVGAGAFAIDAAFQRYAFADKDGNVRIRRLSDDRELLRLPGGGLVTGYRGLSFSPDGRFLHQRFHVAKGFQTRLWDLEGPMPKAVLPDDENSGLGFRSDSRQCAASYPDGTIRLLETESGQELRRFRVDVDLTAEHGLLWNPKLAQLLIQTQQGLWLLDLDTGKVSSVGPKLALCDWADWHPDGRLLAVSGRMTYLHDVYLWDVPAGRLRLPPLTGHKNHGVVMRFNHGGDRLLSTDWSGSGKLWDTRSGQLLLSVPISTLPPCFSHDDRLVGTGSGGKVRLYRCRRGEELCTVVRYSPTSQVGFQHVNSGLDPTGRLCAFLISQVGIALVDLQRCEEVALLSLPKNTPVRFDRDGGLWTGGPAGLLRWPPSNDAKTGQRRYGPPQRILQRTPHAVHGSSPDLSVVAIPQPFSFHGALLFHRDGKHLHRLGPQEDVRRCAVSPDGRWVATGSHNLSQGAGAKVWDAKSGQHAKDLPVGNVCGVAFSPGPDGKWLLTTSGGPRLWAVGTWEEGPKLGGTASNPYGAFSSDGKLLALGDEPGVVRLLMADTGKELARLTAPEQVRMMPCCFTSDGSKLVTAGEESGRIYIFDLAIIRAGLAELDLDWDAPAFPAESKAVPPPLSISFDLGDMQHWAEADALVKEAAREANGNEHAKALATLRKAVKIAPTLATPHNNLAWLLLTGPKELRDPAEALPQAKKAVELEPEQALYLNTLGVALYRAARFADAVPVLEDSLRRQLGKTDAFDLYFLAMCHHRLGDAARARDCRQRGVSWFESNKSKLPATCVAELTGFKAEADAVLAEAPGKIKE